MAKHVPSSRLIDSMRESGVDWWVRLAELIDNSFDASANRIVVDFKSGILSVSDDGRGIADLMKVVVIGERSDHESTLLGRYGIGAKDAWLATGPIISIDSVHRGTRRTITVDADKVANSDWDYPDPISETNAGPSGTIISITLSARSKKPSTPGIVERLSWAFAPALRDGKQIIYRGEVLSAQSQPPLLNAVVENFEIEGKSVSINIGEFPLGHKPRSGPYDGPIWFQFGHRTLFADSTGTNARCYNKVGGTVVLGKGWRMLKNKTGLRESDRDELGEQVYHRIESLLNRSEESAEQIESTALISELESLLNQSLNGVRKEKRSKTDESKTGSIAPVSSGRKRSSATKSQKQPGSVTETTRTGTKLAFADLDLSTFGKYEHGAKTVILNQLHPVIALARSEDNRDLLLSCLSVVIANHDATIEGGQKLLACSLGDFLGAYVKLITSLVKKVGAQ